ncbi:MAG TPA: tRNA pseudouridine(13) synthase TruD [Nitrospiraceae bacterium]|nr:tRNA pseudouridine(13) synthase TruD [Nitrospiraceae bacterium]
MPFLTADVPGIMGVIRATPEDFQVEERPLYLPCGKGEHLYLRITKRGLSTPQLVSYLSARFGIKARCIGVAGLKDAKAVTTQMVSLQGVSSETVSRSQLDARILSVEVLGCHRNRLRTGHHAGNVFRLVIRGARPCASESVPVILNELSRRGAPNFFGPQRQGRQGLNYSIGAALLTDSPRRDRMPKSKRLWYLHAYQSFLFNRILAQRIDRLDRVLVGDWAMKHDNGACFQVEDVAVEQRRADAFEISPTGPLFGSRAPWASGEPGEVERTAVAELGATPESLRQAAYACRFRGERRSLRVRLGDLDWSLMNDALTLCFTLPPGAYATSIVRELMKSESR